MSFIFTCPHCRNTMEAEEAWIGQNAACPSCSKEIVIQQDAPAAPASGATFVFTCPYCQNAMEAEEAWIGQNTQCPSCWKEITIQKDAAQAAVPAPAVSSTFVFTCPYCRNAFNAETGWIGQTMQCPSCGNQVIIQQNPAPVQAPVYAQTPAVPAVPAAPGYAQPPAVPAVQTAPIQTPAFAAEAPVQAPAVPVKTGNPFKQTETEQPYSNRLYPIINFIGKAGSVVACFMWILIIILVVVGLKIAYLIAVFLWIISILVGIIFSWIAHFMEPGIKFHLRPGEQLLDTCRVKEDIPDETDSPMLYIRLTDRRIVFSQVTYGYLPQILADFKEAMSKPKIITYEYLKEEINSITMEKVRTGKGISKSFMKQKFTHIYAHDRLITLYGYVPKIAQWKGLNPQDCIIK